MKNKTRFEALTQLTRLIHLTLLFLLFVFCSTVFLSMKNNQADEEVIAIDSVDRGYEVTPAIVEGKRLFKANCGACHANDMTSDLSGPALGDVTERWEGKDIRNWVRNAPKYLVENPEDKYTTSLAKKYAATMTAFPNLKDEEIENILSYIETVYNQ